MKQNSLIFAVLAFFCLSVGQAEEHYNMVFPAQAPQMPQVQSAANAAGTVVELLYRADINSHVLAVRQSSGERQYLYHRNQVGVHPAVPEITKAIYWLTPDSFACVGAGRLNSYYTLYRLKPMEDAPCTVHAWKEAEGCCHFRLEWQVREGQLIGCWKGKPYVTLSPLSALFGDGK